MNKSIKILHLLRSSTFSGAENVVCQIVNMHNDDHDIEFAYCCPNGEIEKELNKRGIKHIPLSSFSLKEVRKKIKSFNPDIVHAHDISASIMASMATIGLGIKVISHVHVNNDNMARVNFKTLAFLSSSIRYSHIFWVSESCYKCFAFHNLLSKKSTVLTNVMDKNGILLRASEASDKTAFDIVYVGRITYQKNPERLISVLAKIIERIPEVTVGIVGTGDLLEDTRKLAEKLELLNNISFLGFVSNPLGILNNSKLMIMTSRFEGLPMTVLESLALGVPVISTPVDGLVDVITSGVEGYLIDDDDKMAEQFVGLLMDDEKRIIMANNAKKKFDEISDVSHYKSVLDGIYKMN